MNYQHSLFLKKQNILLLVTTFAIVDRFFHCHILKEIICRSMVEIMVPCEI